MERTKKKIVPFCAPGQKLRYLMRKKGRFWHKRDDSCASMVCLATGMFERMRGLLFYNNREGPLLLFPCKDIHTFGMRYRIDVAFIDKYGVVVQAQRDVMPLRRLRNRSAVAVIERSAVAGLPWFEKGDVIGLAKYSALSAEVLRRHTQGLLAADAATPAKCKN